MEYEKTTLHQDIVIEKIVSVHYFEYAKNYIFEGESHNFWEFLYVDKGEVEVMADTHKCILKHSEIIFHKPDEFHNVWANGKVAPNLIVVSFECNSISMKYFENKIMIIDDFEKNLLAQIIRESKNAFTSNLGDPSLKKLMRTDKPLFGCEQLIKLSLEQMLINMIRKINNLQKENKLSSSVKERFEGDTVVKIIHFLEENVTKDISFTDVLHFSGLSSTILKTLFKDKTGMTVMEYNKKLKIMEAKSMIREGYYNFTQIAEKLGYTSIHYFSTDFKKTTDMTPSQYALSVNVKV